MHVSYSQGPVYKTYVSGRGALDAAWESCISSPEREAAGNCAQIAMQPCGFSNRLVDPTPETPPQPPSLLPSYPPQSAIGPQPESKYNSSSAPGFGSSGRGRLSRSAAPGPGAPPHADTRRPACLFQLLGDAPHAMAH